MRLPSGAGAELARNGILERADAENHKRNRDIEVGAGRVWVTAPDGGRWAVTMATDGAIGSEDPSGNPGASPGGGGAPQIMSWMV